MSALADALARTAFTVDGRDCSVADVATAALYLSEWSGVEHRTRAGLAALEHAGADEDAVKAAAETFRRARRLLAAEEMEAWLARRGLTAGAWMRWVRADVARRAAGEVAADDEGPAGPTALYTEALCSGALARSARWLAEVLLVDDETSLGPGPPRVVDPAPLVALGVDETRGRALLDELTARRGVLGRLAERIAGPDAVQSHLRAHPSDWLGVEYRVLALPNESAAREAILCVRDDAMALEEVAGLTGSEVQRRRALLAETPPGLRDPLLSATAGELVGPLADAGGFAVLAVDRKVPPSAEIDEVNRRVRGALLGQHLDREMTTRVRWHDRL